MKTNNTKIKGFTLLELLVSMAIIGILTSIAIPQFSSYRAKAFDTVALADVKSIALAEENYFIDNQQYYACQDLGCTELEGIVRISEGVNISVTTEADSFIVRGKHRMGQKEYIWDSNFGGLR